MIRSLRRKFIAMTMAVFLAMLCVILGLVIHFTGENLEAESIRTLAFYMNTLSGVGTVQGQGMAAAAALIMFVPNLLLFIVSQSSVMNTMAHSGLK